MKTGNFFAEMKRRNVFRAAAFYAAAAWLLVQVATQVFPVFDVPQWLLRAIVVAAVLGFPFAIVLAWLYEWTPQGFQRESEVPPDESITRQTGRRLDRWIIAVLSLAVVLLLADKLILRRSADAPVSVRTVPDKSIAVLPFVNMSGSANDNDFSDGITEEILNALAQLPDLKVAARTSAFQFKGKNIDLRRVGETLDVGYVLEGSVQRAGDAVRITAQLIDARSGYHLWSEKYDRALTNVFAIEDEISKAIASQMQVTLAGGREKPLVKAATANPQAHELYLKGLATIVERGPALKDAVALFKQAIELDRNYSSAWAGLSQAYELLPWYKLAPWPESLTQAEDAARKAIALDAQLAEAHTALANVLRNRFDFAAATDEYEAALKLNRGSAETLNQYAQMLLRMGRLEEGIAKEEAAVAIDPLAPNPRYMLGLMLADLHRFEEAIASQKRVVDQNAMYSYATFQLAYDYLYVSKLAEAEHLARIAAQQVGEDADAITTCVRAVANPSARPDALKVVAEGRVGRYSLAYITDAFWCAMLGANNEALDRLERWRKTTEEGALFDDAQMLWAPAFDSIRGTERFRAIMQSLGLPPVPIPAGQAR